MRAEPPPLIKVSGAPYERGVQHGRACGDLIRRYPDVLLRALELEGGWRGLDITRALLDRDALLVRAMSFLPALASFAPHLVEEVRGISDGARLSFAEALLVNVRAEVMGTMTADAQCTSFAVGRSASTDGWILSGQTLDQHPLNRDLMIILHVEPDRGPATLMCSFAGLVGYPGINERGVSVFQNALSTRQWLPGAMPHYFLKRVLLEQNDAKGCEVIARGARCCSSANYVVTDGKGALRDFEITPFHMAVLEASSDILVHTNHFRDSGLAGEEALLQRIPDSARRAPRMEALLSAKHGSIGIPDIKSALADHDGFPTSICRHQDGVETIASMIAEPEQGRLHVAAGQACHTKFVTYSL